MASKEVITTVTVVLYDEDNGNASQCTFSSFDELFIYLDENPNIQLMEIL